VGQFKTVWLSLLMIGLLPFSVLAEGEDIPAGTEALNEEKTNNRILRQTNTVKGYQPLTVAGQEIEAAYIEETLGERHGAIVLLHDQGERFESEGVITPLRHGLAEHGWSTLTLTFDYPYEPKILLSVADASNAQEQAPEEATTEQDKDESSTEENSQEGSVLPPVSNQERIQAALAFLQAKDIKRIIFIGHGAGGDLAIELLDTIKMPVSALILVGATALPENDTFNGFDFPILDIYGSNDLDAVPDAVQYRKVIMKRINNTLYEVRRIEGADHIFLGLSATLISTVNGWLRRHFVEQADN